MKAPDKLYIGRRNYGPLIGGWESQPFTSKEIESIEYIRKDALIEWAEDIKAKTAWYEIQVAMDDVIDKLNSM
jgi:hypothetical protein